MASTMTRRAARDRGRNRKRTTTRTHKARDRDVWIACSRETVLQVIIQQDSDAEIMLVARFQFGTDNRRRGKSIPRWMGWRFQGYLDGSFRSRIVLYVQVDGDLRATPVRETIVLARLRVGES